MAHDTSLSCRSLVIYQVYVRNHTTAGTFEALGADLARLAALKKEPALQEGQLIFTASQPVIQAAWFMPAESLFGVFNTSGMQAEVELPLPDGVYEDLLGGEALRVQAGSAHLPPSAAVVKCWLDRKPTHLSLPGFVSLPDEG